MNDVDLIGIHFVDRSQLVNDAPLLVEALLHLRPVLLQEAEPILHLVADDEEVAAAGKVRRGKATRMPLREGEDVVFTKADRHVLCEGGEVEIDG